MFTLLAAVCGVASVTAQFTIWDHCVHHTTECLLPLGVTRYAYGSAHESGSETWYLIGGTGQSMEDYSFVTEDSIIEVTLPSDVYSFESQCADTYAQDLPFGLGQGAGAVIDDTLYSFGGFSGSPDWKYLNYSFYSNLTAESNFSEAAEIPTKTSAACSVTVGDEVYLIGGLNDGSISNQTLKYNASEDEWTVLSSMNTSRFAPGCAYYDGKIYVFGGQTGNWGPELNTTEIYEISTDSWMASNATLSYSAHWITAAHIQLNVSALGMDENFIFVMGGTAGWPQVMFDNVDVYHIETDSIIERTSMLHHRYAFHAIAPSHGSWGSNTLLLAGGKDDGGFVLSDVDAIHCGYIMPSNEPTTEPTMLFTTEAIVEESTEDPGVELSMSAEQRVGVSMVIGIMLHAVI